MENKKGLYTLGSLGAVAIALVVAAIVIAIGSEVLSDVQDKLTGASTYTCGSNGTAGYNATCGGLEGTETFGDWLDTVALILVAAVVIGIIATSFGGGAEGSTQ